MRIKRITTFLLASVMLTGLLFGCSAGPKGATLYHDGKRVEVKTIMTMDGYDISLDLYRYYFCNVKSTYDEGDAAYWESNLDKEAAVLDETMSSVRSLVSTIRLAQRLDIALTDEELEGIEDEIDATIDSLGSYEAYASALESSYMTEDIYRFLCEMEQLNTKLLSRLKAAGGELAVSEEDMLVIIENEFVRARHIFINKNTQDAQSIIEEAYEKVKAGGDFGELLEQYSEDVVDEAGYYFGKGYTTEDFEQAVRGLETGEISGIVETSDGYHIIERLALESDYIEENISTMIEEYQSVQYSGMLSDIGEAMEITLAPEYSYIGIDTLK